jgi:hypothetical protein
MGQSLKTRYKEHTQRNKFNKEQLGYEIHILKNVHCCGKMEEIMDETDHDKRATL